jgi:hypothetical protein
MQTAERMLKWVLCLIALSELGAIAGVVMPVAWMRVAHEWLGLGPFPEGVTLPYLARSLSAFYVVHAGSMLVCATDVRRYEGMIAYLAWAGIAFAALMSVLDILAGFPWYWMAIEGPGLIVLSVAILYFQRQVRAGQPPDRNGG